MNPQRHQDPGPPALLAGSGQPFALRWSGDAELDAVLACGTAAQAARMLVGCERATRPVIRWLARSVLGAGPSVAPGTNANLFPMAVVLGVDAPNGDPGRLAADDLAAVLASSASPHASTRRAPLSLFARDALQRLVADYSRQRRRGLAIEVLTDHRGDGDAFLRLLDEAADVAYLDAFDTPKTGLAGLVEHLRWVLAHYRVPSRRAVLTGARTWRGRSPVDLPEGLQVRVPWNREQLESEAAAFDNCLGTYYRKVEVHGALIATVWDGEAPLAAVQISPSGGLEQLLGFEDAHLDVDDRVRVVAALRQAGVLPQPIVPAPLTVHERIMARIACRAALLLAEEIEPPADSLELEWSGHTYGDRTLRLLARAAEVLTDEEHELLRAGRHPDPIHGWSFIGVMLVAAGENHPDLTSLDGRAPFRQTARTIARKVLHGTYVSGTAHPVRDLRLLLADPTIPGWQRNALAEVLEQHEP